MESVSRQTKWLRENMTEERRERKKEIQKAYYYRNQERERQRSLDRYYAKKAVESPDAKIGRV